MGNDDEPTRPNRRTSTTLALHSIRFEQACIDLGLSEGSPLRDVLRGALAASYDDGVRSCESLIRRLRAEAEVGAATAADLRRQLVARG